MYPGIYLPTHLTHWAGFFTIKKKKKSFLFIVESIFLLNSIIFYNNCS